MSTALTIDAGELDRLGELFTDDVTYDVTDLGEAPLEGIAAIRDAALALGEINPVGHHVTNTVLTGEDENRARARPKGIGVNTDGTTGSATYEDTVVRTQHGWRIRYRKVLARRTPLEPKQRDNPSEGLLPRQCRPRLVRSAAQSWPYSETLERHLGRSRQRHRVRVLSKVPSTATSDSSRLIRRS